MKEKITVFDVVSTIFVILVILVSVLPFLYVISASFNSGADYMKGGVYFFPRKFSLDSYKTIFQDTRLFYGLLNSSLRTIIGPFIHTFLCAVVAYAMAHPKLKARKFYYWANTIPMFFSGGLIPFYLVLKYLGLVNTFWVYIFPAAYSVWNMITLQVFFGAIPSELKESGYLDGAGEFKIFWRIYMPCAPAALATVFLWNAVYHWNSFFDGLFYNSNEKLMLLQEYLYKLVQETSLVQIQNAITFLPESSANIALDASIRTIQSAAVVISMLPVLIIFPLIKKYFVVGVTAGSVKS